MNDTEFAQIIEETKAVVLSAIQKHLNPKYSESIDDIVQESYLRAYNGLVKKKFKEESKLSTWLYTIAKNEALRMNSKLMKEEKKQEKLIDSLSSQNQGSHNETALSRDWILKLPKKYAEILLLVIQGYSEKEISSELSIPKGTVKSRIFRAKEQLQQIINKEEAL